jgi:predicted heme/steroid binding protein
MKTVIPIIVMLMALCWQPSPSAATEVYAKQTGKSCSACHVDPGGGGELTATGREFAASLQSGGESATASMAKKVLHFGAGYLHLLIAILWFGTILYVHLVLKPAYAAGGLPRGEVRVGLLSMAVMGVTGIVLTWFRIGSPAMMLQSRFGILLLVKIGLYLVMVLTALYVVLFIGPKLKAKRNDAPELSPGGSLTPDELATFDGKEGRAAVFAFEGRLYDATASRLWKQGVHMGRHNAGQDLTEALKLAPHDASKLTALPVVGSLAAQGPRKAPLHERVFFFMAYMNLTIVFLIVLIIALWRWW